ELLALLARAGETASGTAKLPPATLPVTPGLDAGFSVPAAGVPGAHVTSGDATTSTTAQGAAGGALAGQTANDPATGTRQRRLRRFPYLLLGLLTLFGLAVALIGSLQGATVPAVIGLTEEEALRKLEAEGLTSSVAARISSLAVPAGQVISSDPPPGTRVDTGHLVALTVSTGPPPPPAIVPRPPPRDAEAADEGDRNEDGDEAQAADDREAEAAEDRAEEAEEEAEDRAERERARDDRKGSNEGKG
ncbi:MAG: PASTA domain-containing protein, partial [Actinomycetota bacterium]|nr:PASTA domain-containing protein [Actinomycetota bacterium]